jgi:nicotinate-nucleotide adenylyltransferase
VGDGASRIAPPLILGQKDAMSLPARRIALFGGSFDPVHPAHVEVARAAVAQAGLDRVLFLPAAQSPLKAHGPVASGPARLEMLRAALAGKMWAEVSDWELGRPGPSYSWQTAAHFRAAIPAGWYWLMGVDQWRQLERWQHWERLAEDVTFLVFTRDGLVPEPRPGVKAQFLTGTFEGSSTAVREARRTGGDWRKLVAPGVAAVIGREALYK